MSKKPSGQYIKETVFVVGGFGIGYMVGNQGELFGEWSWLLCGLFGAAVPASITWIFYPRLSR